MKTMNRQYYAWMFINSIENSQHQDIIITDKQIDARRYLQLRRNHVIMVLLRVYFNLFSTGWYNGSDVVVDLGSGPGPFSVVWMSRQNLSRWDESFNKTQASVVDQSEVNLGRISPLRTTEEFQKRSWILSCLSRRCWWNSSSRVDTNGQKSHSTSISSVRPSKILWHLGNETGTECLKLKEYIRTQKWTNDFSEWEFCYSMLSKDFRLINSICLF